MALMRKHVESLTAVGPEGDLVAFSEEPVSRYNDVPREVVDATVWMLGREGRPHAVLVIEMYDFFNYELTSVADGPKIVRAPSWRWSPRQSGFTWKGIPTTTPPSDTADLRLRQIKQLSRRFEASEQFSGQTYHLELKPQPFHQYEDVEQGVLAGAVFAWAHDTNVEILMFIEARKEEVDSSRWVAGFSRLASASLDVTYREQDFWSSPATPRPTPTDTYFFHIEPLTADERAALGEE